ncbi:MAG: hypothetical protein A3F16_05650 [Deltaproteobacteria bacterium RIFCSPHIGHO2_12_FULL_43_9]|nr:MAG: hypothetical protein A3F16_05650 [Deltaproteobacteria bacterium RIFCSPHIGHO2_12_FULL_43_9]
MHLFFGMGMDRKRYLYFFQKNINRVVLLIMMIFLVYMGYRNWQLLRTSFTVSEENQFVEQVDDGSYGQISVWLEERLSLPSLEVRDDQDPFTE